MSRYLVGIFFCLSIILAYPAFRWEAFEELRARHVRKRDIRHKLKGALNFWFYTELEKAYGLGKYGILLRLYPIVAGLLTILHIALGWIDALALPDLITVSMTAVYLSVIILVAGYNRNRRLFGSGFILLAKRETKSYVHKSKIFVPKTKDGFLIEYYSTGYDLILAAAPLVFPVLMGVFEHLKL